MPTLFLLCGLPASGKTTYAQRLASQGQALRLASDDWLVPLFGQQMTREFFDERQKQVRALQWQVAINALTCGVDVLLDEGFWRREDRENYRQRAKHLGIKVQVLWFDVPLPELQMRLEQRNLLLPPGTFHIDAAALAQFAARFEPPGTEEDVRRITS